MQWRPVLSSRHGRVGVGRAGVAGLAVAGLLLAACGDEKSTSTDEPTVTSAGSAPNATSAGSTLESTDPLALDLDRSILSLDDLAAAGVTAVPAPTAGPGPTGPLTVDGIAAHFPIPGADVRGRLLQEGATAGASQRYNIGGPGVPGPILTVIGVKFASSDSAGRFAAALLSMNPSETVTAHSEIAVGVAPIRVVRFSPSVPAGVPPIEVVATPVIYPDGMAYFVEVGGPPGVIPDSRTLDFVKAQDFKYQAP